MRLMEWLRLHNARLDVRLECELDPMEQDIAWHCEIRGFPSPNALRPAVFIMTYPDGPEPTIEAFAADPTVALRLAVVRLRGLSINIISNESDRTITVPNDLMP